MKIKTYKGYSDSRYVEVLEPLTLEDFIIEETAPHVNSMNNAIVATLNIKLKDEVKENISVILADRDCWNKDKGKIDTFWKHFRREVKFNGCRSQEAKDKKLEATRGQMMVEMADRKTKRLEGLLLQVKEELDNNIERMNHMYERSVKEVLFGERMSSNFINTTLDDVGVVEELAYLELEIAELNKKRSELEKAKSKARNANMLNYLSEKGWNDDAEDEDDNEKIVVVQKLRDEMTEVYKNSEAFEYKPHPSLLQIDIPGERGIGRVSHSPYFFLTNYKRQYNERHGTENLHHHNP